MSGAGAKNRRANTEPSRIRGNRRISKFHPLQRVDDNDESAIGFPSAEEQIAAHRQLSVEGDVDDDVDEAIEEAEREAENPSEISQSLPPSQSQPRDSQQSQAGSSTQVSTDTIISSSTLGKRLRERANTSVEDDHDPDSDHYTHRLENTVVSSNTAIFTPRIRNRLAPTPQRNSSASSTASSSSTAIASPTSRFSKRSKNRHYYHEENEDPYAFAESQ